MSVIKRNAGEILQQQADRLELQSAAPRAIGETGEIEGRGVFRMAQRAFDQDLQGEREPARGDEALSLGTFEAHVIDPAVGSGKRRNKGCKQRVVGRGHFVTRPIPLKTGVAHPLRDRRAARQIPVLPRSSKAVTIAAGIVRMPRREEPMLSRRDVLATTAAAGAALAATSAPQPAKAMSRGRIIVDAQVHLWLMNTPERPWPADGIGQAHIPRPFSYYELLARMDEAGVDRVVIVPPSWEGYHNEYAMEAAKKWPHRFAVMGRLRLDDPKSKDLLATWKDQPGMLGVRHTFNRLQSGGSPTAPPIGSGRPPPRPASRS